MATLTVKKLTEAGDTVSLVAAAAGGDQYKNAFHTFLYVDNQDAASTNVTITVQTATVDINGFGNLTKADKVVSIAAGVTVCIGPLPSAFNDASGYVQVSYTAATGMTVSAITA